MKTLLFSCLLICSMVNSHSLYEHADFSINEIEEKFPFPVNITEDAALDTMGLLKKYNYDAEEHFVETDDGYILTLHRMSLGKALDRTKPPVILLHGLFSSSADWIVNGPGWGLGNYLAENGYDVWMANFRGNTYSKMHVDLSPKNSSFWKFSWNEMGYYDLPAIIDYTINATSFKKVHLIGHSQGGTSFLVMCSTRPEYNDKILSMNGLAIASYIHNSKNPVMKLLSKFATNHVLGLYLGSKEVLPDTMFGKYLSNYFCKDEMITQDICSNLLIVFGGYNPDQINKTMLPVYLSHDPAGASTKQIVHFVQEYQSGIFRKFDYGVRNIAIYGSRNPPKYDLSKVRCPTAIHYGGKDNLVDAVDSERMISELPNTTIVYKYEQFAHLDFIWAIDSVKLIYKNVLNVMMEQEKL